jgi:hypothetical protein
MERITCFENLHEAFLRAVKEKVSNEYLKIAYAVVCFADLLESEIKACSISLV